MKETNGRRRTDPHKRDVIGNRALAQLVERGALQAGSGVTGPSLALAGPDVRGGEATGASPLFDRKKRGAAALELARDEDGMRNSGERRGVTGGGGVDGSRAQARFSRRVSPDSRRQGLEASEARVANQGGVMGLLLKQRYRGVRERKKNQRGRRGAGRGRSWSTEKMGRVSGG